MGGSFDHLGTTFSLINYTGPDSKFINLTAIPEPASLLAVAGLLGSGLALRMRKRG